MYVRTIALCEEESDWEVLPDFLRFHSPPNAKDCLTSFCLIL